MSRFARIITMCLLSACSVTTYAQVEADPQLGTAIISANTDTPASDVQATIELLQEHSISNFRLRVTDDDPGIAVSINTKAKPEICAELEAELREAGLENLEIVPAPVDWIEFSFARLKTSRETTGAIVFLRADWCVTCLLLEKKAFADAELLSLIHEHGVPFIKADFTDPSDKDSESVQLADRVGTKQVPAFIIYPPNGAKSLVVHDAVEPAAISKLIRDNFPLEAAPEEAESDETEPETATR